MYEEVEKPHAGDFRGSGVVGLLQRRKPSVLIFVFVCAVHIITFTRKEADDFRVPSL